MMSVTACIPHSVGVHSPPNIVLGKSSGPLNAFPFIPTGMALSSLYMLTTWRQGRKDRI